MHYFLRGFADELVKLGAPFPGTAEPRPVKTSAKPVNPYATQGSRRGPSGFVRPRSTAPRGPGALRRPSNAMGPTGDALRAIPTQQMSSPSKIKPPTTRPSPKYVPVPRPPPDLSKVPLPKKTVRRKAKAPKQAHPRRRRPGEGRFAYLARRGQEKKQYITALSRAGGSVDVANEAARAQRLQKEKQRKQHEQKRQEKLQRGMNLRGLTRL